MLLAAWSSSEVTNCLECALSQVCIGPDMTLDVTRMQNSNNQPTNNQPVTKYIFFILFPPDSYCPPLNRPTPEPRLVILSPERLAARLRQRDLEQSRESRRHGALRDVTAPAFRHRRHHQGHRVANRQRIGWAGLEKQ